MVEKTLAFSACALGVGAAAWAQQRPNIILLMSDQHRSDVMGCMGNYVAITPNLDALASDGTLFQSGYSSCPSSTPARAGLLTGMSPWHHGMLGYGRLAPHYRYEGPQMLHDAGYFTYAIGKNHWYPQRGRRGLDGMSLDESGRVEDVGFVSDYRQWVQQQSPGTDPDATGLGWNAHGARAYALADTLHPTYWTGLKACEFISHYNLQKPLFLKVSFARPHSPFDPPQRYVDAYQGRIMPARAIGDWCSAWSKELDVTKSNPEADKGNFGEAYAQRAKLYYYANVTFIDEQIGKIIDELKRKGMYDNSLIVYISDHGDQLGDHYHWRKTYPFEASTHVPYIVKWPSSLSKHPASASQPVELRDILPTFLETAGVDVPEDMDGRSLYRLAEGKGKDWRRYIDLEHALCYRSNEEWCGLTDGRMKYVWYFYDGRELLFDLQKDPNELHNTAADKKYSKTLKTMRQALVEHLSERGIQYVKDGKLVQRKGKILYSPLYPREEKTSK